MAYQTSAARRRIMSAIVGTGNRTTELRLASLLRRCRISGWRRHRPLPGRPDFSWSREKVAVFVDGCFWHGCPWCYKAPRNNKLFWREKLDSNQRRDRRVEKKLRDLGWRVLRIWECRVTRPSTTAKISASPRASSRLVSLSDLPNSAGVLLARHGGIAWLAAVA